MVLASSKHGSSATRFALRLTDGATAEVHRYLRSHRPGILKETKKMGYSIHVRGFHDAAQIKAYVNGGELEQIQFLLGHVSVLTTERYLGCKQNLEEPVNDRFGCLFAFRPVDLR
jgi:site-specific recombinase XerD